MEQLLLWTFASFVFIQLVFQLLIFRKVAFVQHAKATRKNIHISVLICAKNEAENLKLLLPSIIEQDFPTFEVVLINDHSSDDTLEVMKHYANNYAHIKVVDVVANEAFLSSKKYALTLGIKASSHDYLLLTDADCQPVSRNWITTMSSHFSNDETIVLGYGAYKTAKGFLNKLVRFETVISALHYLGLASIGLPYMGVGRNLAYRKDEFFKVNGFTKHINVLSGDDDLFINEVASPNNTAICLHKDSFTLSFPVDRFSQWWQQKRRHVTTASRYKSKHKLLLGLSYLSNLMVWVLLLVLVLFKMQWEIALLLFMLKFMISWIIFWKSCSVLNEKKLAWYYWILEPLLLSLQMCIFMANLFSKPKHWN